MSTFLGIRQIDIEGNTLQILKLLQAQKRHTALRSEYGVLQSAQKTLISELILMEDAYKRQGLHCAALQRSTGAHSLELEKVNASKVLLQKELKLVRSELKTQRQNKDSKTKSEDALRIAKGEVKALSIKVPELEAMLVKSMKQCDAKQNEYEARVSCMSVVALRQTAEAAVLAAELKIMDQRTITSSVDLSAERHFHMASRSLAFSNEIVAALSTNDVLKAFKIKDEQVNAANRWVAEANTWKLRWEQLAIKYNVVNGMYTSLVKDIVEQRQVAKSLPSP